MKRLNYLLCALAFLFSIGVPVCVRAESVLPPTMVINEIQTNGAGSGATLQEFIELINVSNTPLLIAGWELRYTNSSGNEYLLYTFPDLTSIESYQKIILVPTTAPVDFLATLSPKLAYTPPTSSGIAASAGTITLVSNLAIKADSVSWSSTASAAIGEIVQYGGGGKSIQRKVVNAAVVVSGSSKNDFELLDTPTPEVGLPVIPEPPLEEDETPIEPDTPPVETPQEEPPITEEPDGELPVSPPPSAEPETKIHQTVLVNELYIDPESPETDANNEWVELYNPSTQEVDISGYVVAVGSSFSYKYTFPNGTVVPASGFIVISSANTTIALSNGGGAAKISDPNGAILDSTIYAEAQAGQAWAKNNSGQWEWTTTPTNMAANIITAPLPPAIKAAAVKAAKTKKATAAKKTTVKAATTKAAKAKAVKASTFDEPALIAAPTPIPGWLLAVLVSLALLYVGYEYRFEARNTIYKLRNNRRAGR